MPFQLDIRTGVQTSVILTAVLGILCLFLGIRGLINARNMRFYRMRRDRIVRSWRQVFLALVLIALSFGLNTYAEPLAYSFYPPSPTPTITPSITNTPTISLTPSSTETEGVNPITLVILSPAVR